MLQQVLFSCRMPQTSGGAFSLLRARRSAPVGVVSGRRESGGGVGLFDGAGGRQVAPGVDLRFQLDAFCSVGNADRADDEAEWRLPLAVDGRQRLSGAGGDAVLLAVLRLPRYFRLGRAGRVVLDGRAAIRRGRRDSDL
jgi:hypothetical protein